MSFADVLKKRAEETGQKVIEAEKPVIEKAENKSAFAAALQQRKATQDPNQINTEFDTGSIPVWSFSTLKDYEQCPYRVYLAKIEKKPQKQSDAASRGEAIHQMAEDFVRAGTGEVPKELSKFDIAFRDLQQLFADGKVIMEENWGIRKDWSPCDWKDPDIWGRAKLDVFVQESETAAKIIDHKGLPLDTPIPTPDGWATMASLQVGDYVFDKDGRPTQVTVKSRVKNIGVFKLTFDDTTEIRCDEEHLWYMFDGTTKPVTELIVGDCLPIAKPLELPEQDLPLDPYVLGYWLGNGKHTSGEISAALDDEEALRKIFTTRGFELSGQAYLKNGSKGWAATIKGIRGHLSRIGVRGNKHIPAPYLRGSYEQRKSLLQGLMDSDGSANAFRRSAVFCNTNPVLMRQAYELACSLGLRAKVHTLQAMGFGKTVTAFQMTFRPVGFNPFLLPRKADKMRWEEWGPGLSNRRRIVRIERIDSVPTQCIAVAADSHTYLCGDQFCVTHNTGKKFGNELKHGDQGLSYALHAFHRYPELETFKVEFWYLDHAETLERLFTRRQLGILLPRYHRRAQDMTTAKVFPAKPNCNNCRWCAYGNGKFGTGDCEFAEK